MSVNDERAAVKKELSATQEKLAALASKIAVAESSGKADKVAKLKKKQSKYEAKVSELKAKKKALKAGKRKRGGDDEDGAAEQAPAAAGGSSDKRQRTGEPAADAAGSNGNGGAGGADAAPQKRVRGPRGGVSRLFAGNLSFKITADKLISFLQGNATHIMWLTDKETGRFYGSAFVEMASAEAANAALLLNGNKCMGRPIKLSLAPPRPTDKWPPAEAEITAGGNTKKEEEEEDPNAPPVPTRSAKPSPECKKLFLGNLSYSVDEQNVRDFFKDCGTLTHIRWLTRRDTGEFRGQGFVEFEDSEQADKAVLLNDRKLLGRKLIIDWDE